MPHRTLLVFALIIAGIGCKTSRELGDASEGPSRSGSPEPTMSVSPTGQGASVPMSAFQTTNIVLYQPDGVLGERLPGVDALAAYLRKLQASAAPFFPDGSAPETLDIVVVIKPGGRSRVWFVSDSRPEADGVLARLRRELESVEVPTIKMGPVAFAISAAIAGAKREVSDGGGFRPPMPKEWQDAATKVKEPGVIPDDIVAVVWPDEGTP